MTSFGRPRTAGLTAELLDAAAQILATRGYAAVTVTALAAATGTTRPTFYRRFPDVAHLVLALLAPRCAAPAVDIGSLREDLLVVHHHQGVLLADPVVRRGLLGVLVAAQRDEQLAHRVHVELFLPWRDLVAGILDAGARRGEVDAAPTPAQVDLVVDLLRGAALMRTLPLEVTAGIDRGATHPVDNCAGAGAGGAANGGDRLAARTVAAALCVLTAR